MALADTGIQKTDLIKWASDRIVGTQVKTPVGKAKLLKKYPFIATTSKGCFQWIEIYLAERGLYDAEIKKRIAQIYKVVNSGSDNSVDRLDSGVE